MEVATSGEYDASLKRAMVFCIVSAVLRSRQAFNHLQSIVRPHKAAGCSDESTNRDTAAVAVLPVSLGTCIDCLQRGSGPA